MAKKIKISEIKNADLPINPGVYIFMDKNGKPVYVGKAKNLQNRVKSYFALRLAPKTAAMVASADQIKLVLTNSEIEALILEAKLVKKYMPKFNSELKDDKSPIYIGITKEEYPRVITLRQTQIKDIKLKELFGPFTDAKSVRLLLKRIRRIFPYSQHKPGKRPCIYSQIGLCSPCPSKIIHASGDEKKILRKNYFLNVRRVKKILNGGTVSLIRSLTSEMKGFSNKQEFEEAEHSKFLINSLVRLTTPINDVYEYVKDPNFLSDIRDKELKDLKKFISPFIKLNVLARIECYDVAHLAGAFPTASMVTFIDGEPDKRYYRQFRIYGKKKINNDFENMKQVLRRRMKHFEDWGKPDLIIVDGGKPQVSAAVDILGGQVPVVGVAKRYETLVFQVDGKFVERRIPRGPALFVVQRMRDEAHRFARRYHHALVKKALTS